MNLPIRLSALIVCCAVSLFLADDQPVNSSIYTPGTKSASRDKRPLRLRGGPHLLIDDFLI